MERAKRETLACDLFLAIGSSLVVYPAAGLPVLAKESGSTLVILNRERTDLDGVADVVIHREIGPTLGEAANVNCARAAPSRLSPVTVGAGRPCC